MTRPSKRQRRTQPRTLVDNESLSCIASPFGPIQTPLASILTKEIVLERLEKEIVHRFGLTLSVPRNRQSFVTKAGELVQGKRQDSFGHKKRHINNDPTTALLRSRMVLGVNQCTRVLESTLLRSRSTTSPASILPGTPALILLGRDLYPPNILSHIPLMAQETNTPILLLPGNASIELGTVLGIQRAGIVLFRRNANGNDELSTEDAKRHAQIDSFIDFVKSKLSTDDEAIPKCTPTKLVPTINETKRV